MRPSSVAVVGGAGFIGSQLMKDNPYWFSIDIKEEMDFRVVNARNFGAIVFLAAWQGNTPEDYYLNCELYSSLVESVVYSAKKPHIVFASSAAVYAPDNHGNSHFEYEVPDPPTLYGKSKALGEQVIKDIASSYTILRFSNVYGSGEGHGVIDIFRRGGKVIYGDGEDVRDFISVNKVSSAIARVVADPEAYAGETYNISSGVGQTVNQVFRKYQIGDPTYAPARSWDVHHSVLDNSKAKEAGLL